MSLHTILLLLRTFFFFTDFITYAILVGQLSLDFQFADRCPLSLMCGLLPKNA